MDKKRREFLKIAGISTLAGIGAPAESDNPAALLGHVDNEGIPVMGPVTISVWGLDSV